MSPDQWTWSWEHDLPSTIGWTSAPRLVGLAAVRTLLRRFRMSTFKLRLYVSGQSPQGERALRNLHRICESDLTGEHEIEVVDILQHPSLAETDKIFAVPTLVKCLPPPVRKIIGDLSDRDKVLLGLEVEQPEWFAVK